jgi:hypothetical protein
MAQAQTDDRSARPIAGSLLLDPAPITLTASFDRPATSTLDLATRFIGDQIDRKRNAEAAEAMMDRLWKASFLRFIPIRQGGHPGTMNSPIEEDDDPFFTPAYLTVTVRQLDREVAASDRRARFLFGP